MPWAAILQDAIASGMRAVNHSFPTMPAAAKIVESQAVTQQEHTIESCFNESKLNSFRKEE